MKVSYFLKGLKLIGVVMTLIHLMIISIFIRRIVNIDEIGLYNAVYEIAKSNHFAYPAHGWPDSMVVHPPLHYLLVAVLNKILPLYYAEALPSILILVIAIFTLTMIRETYVYLTLLVSLNAIFLVWSEFSLFTPTFSLRPEIFHTSLIILSLSLLIIAIERKSKTASAFAGASFILAAFAHYPFWFSILGLFCLFAYSGRSSVIRIALAPIRSSFTIGAISTASLIIAFWVIPNREGIFYMISSAEATTLRGFLSNFDLHLDLSRWLANAVSGVSLLHVIALVGSLVPLAILSAPFLAASSTIGKVIGLLFLPGQLMVVLFVDRKWGYYLYPEIFLFIFSLIISILSVLSKSRLYVKTFRLRLLGILLVCVLFSFSLSRAEFKFHNHELEVARFANSTVFSEMKLVSGRIGNWYQLGSIDYRSLEPNYAWSAPEAEKFLVSLDRFDGIIEGMHMSDSVYATGVKSPTELFLDGTLEFRGAYLSQTSKSLDTWIFQPRDKSFASNENIDIVIYDGTNLKYWTTVEESETNSAQIMVCQDIPAVKFNSYLTFSYVEVSKGKAYLVFALGESVSEEILEKYDCSVVKVLNVSLRQVVKPFITRSQINLPKIQVEW